MAATGALALVAAGPLAAQQPVSREQAVRGALAHGPRHALARADSLDARAQLALAREFENPQLGLSYTKDVPQQHVALAVPLDYPWLRSARIGAAEAGVGAAGLRYAFEREAIAFDADTTYTRALASAARARLSRRTARDADSLLSLARLRRDAGDGSELDVQLAIVNAGQLDNAAVTDSLDALAALLAVQASMGLAADIPSVVLSDTLSASVGASSTAGGTPALIAAAEADARSAALSLTLERRRLFAAPALSLGYDTHDPGGQGNTLLPAVGISLPIPLFNRNGASVLAAEAQRDRANAELALARIEVRSRIAEARRAYVAARDRAARSARLVDGANRVAAMSLLAFREGAAALPNVLEAQRAARETLAQYVDDVAAARNAAGLVTLLTLTGTRTDK